MNKNILQTSFFTALLIGVSVLIFFIFLPFFEVLVLSGILAVTLTPLYRKISKILGNRESISALIVLLIFSIIFLVPFSFLFIKVLNESKDFFGGILSESNSGLLNNFVLNIENTIQRFYPGFSINLNELAGIGVDWATSHLSGILSGAISVFTGIFLVFISLFFFLRDGDKFKKILIELSPLKDRYDEEIFKKIKNTISSTVKGVILVAIIQGLLSGIGMAIFGIPNSTLWGGVSAIASLVPGLGTAIVFIPAVIYMFTIGNTASAIGLILWGTVIVGLVDNFLTPYLYSKGIQIHQLLMLFAVLGGLALFGPIGFIFGPIIVALFFVLIEIYRDIIKDDTVS